MKKYFLICYRTQNFVRENHFYFSNYIYQSTFKYTVFHNSRNFVNKFLSLSILKHFWISYIYVIIFK